MDVIETYSFKAVVSLLIIDGNKPRNIMKAFSVLNLNDSAEVFTPEELAALYVECDSYK